jgi:hypothetical protein
MVMLALAFSLGISACGPVESTHFILQADSAIEGAKIADGEKRSPYEYTAAEQYLHKAREKWGTSDFEYSVDYARKAKTLAEKAKERSLKKEDEQP